MEKNDIMSQNMFYLPGHNYCSGCFETYFLDIIGDLIFSPAQKKPQKDITTELYNNRVFKCK